MVELIGGRVEKNDEHGDRGFAPAPGTGVAADGFADGAPKQGGEDGVFREVTAFANRVVNGFDARLTQVGKKPMQKWFNQARGVRVGLRIGGADEDQRHPGQGHEPIF